MMGERRSPFVPNPSLGWLLGMLPVAIASRSLADGMVLGLGAALCPLLLYAAIPPVRALLGERLAFPVSVALSAVLASLYGSAAQAVAPRIYQGLGIYMPLLAVGGLSLHTIRRCSAPAAIETRRAANRFGTVAREAVGVLAACVFIGAIREAIGLGSLSLPAPGQDAYRIYISPSAPLRILASPAGGFILLGLLSVAYRATLRGRGRRIP